MNLPDYHFISAPLWLLTTLHLLTLALHLTAMGVLFGGTLITLYASITKRWDGAQAVGFSRLLPTATAATVTLGVAPLLFLQVVYPAQVYAASIVSGWLWLLILAAVIVAYYALYRASFEGQRSGQAQVGMLVIGVLALAYVSVIYSSVFAMSENPSLIRSLYAKNQSGWVLNPDFGGWVLRWLHMVLGALTLGGFFVALVGQKDEKVFATGKAATLWGMAAASLAGVGYLLTLGPVLKPFMGGPGIIVLTLAVVLALGGLHFLSKKAFWVSGLALFLSLFGMVFVRHTVRLLKLGSTLVIPPVKITWSPFLGFLVCFVVMLGVLVWMVKLFLTTEEKRA